MNRLLLVSLALAPLAAGAHFGMVIPAQSTVMTPGNASVNLRLAFAHPMERGGMNLAKPDSFTVYAGEQKTDLTATLKPAKFFGKNSWTASYKVTRPGVYQFVMQPKPYWEGAEDKFIVHYTKTVIGAFGEEEGWDAPLGLKTEIVPLSRPFANYAGNLFQGQVLMNGKPVPDCEVEVEYFNEKNTHRAPNDYFVTQRVKTDANGVFSYSVPWEGWWGFAALNDAEDKMLRDGTAKDVELGAVLWTEFTRPARSGK